MSVAEDARGEVAAPDGVVDRVALITGGTRRLGRAIALELGGAGYRVAITYRQSEREAAATVEELRTLGVNRGVDAQAFRMDVASEASVAEATAAVMRRFGRVDALVNNAGVHEAEALAEMSVESWDAAFAVHARGPMLVTRALLAELRLRRGRVVHIGSLGGGRAWTRYAHYCASKAALESLTRTMARAFAPEVSVNCVAPGWIEMEGAEAGEAAHFAAKTPMGRNGRAGEVAAAVRFFLTGPEFITGQVLAVDGGLGLV